MGCHGAMNGLRVARAIVESDVRARVLVTAVELCSLHQQYGWDRERVVANALFADGSASIVVDTSPGASRPVVVRATGSMLCPDSGDLMAWKIGDHGFEMHLSARVPRAIEANLGNWLERWLASAGLSIEDVGAWAVHPGGPKILTAVAEAVRLDETAMAPSRSILARYGNMSSPTVLFILEAFARERRPGPWVALGFGPGLAIEAALVSAD
jgi:prepilin-type processing-associated H-X9-DG protein